MSEPTERLRATLAELHRELGTAEALDPKLREPLRQVMGDIERALEPEPEPREESLIDRVSDLAVDFETDHPTIAGVLNRMTHLLASMGI